MRTARSIALAAAVATIPACTRGAPCDAELGPWGEMPDLDMLVGDTVETPLADYFDPRNCVEFAASDDLAVFEVRSSDPAAVAASISGNTVLTTTAVAVADSVRVKVWTTFDDQAARGGDPLFFHEFLVRVRPPPAGR